MTGMTKTSATALLRIVSSHPKVRQEQKNVNTPFGISMFNWRKTGWSTIAKPFLGTEVSI